MLAWLGLTQAGLYPAVCQSATGLFSVCCFFPDPFSDLLQGIKRFAAYVYSWQAVNPLKVLYYIVVVLRFAYLWNTQKGNELLLSKQFWTGSEAAVAIR